MSLRTGWPCFFSLFSFLGEWFVLSSQRKLLIKSMNRTLETGSMFNLQCVWLDKSIPLASEQKLCFLPQSDLWKISWVTCVFLLQVMNVITRPGQGCGCTTVVSISPSHSWPSHYCERRLSNAVPLNKWRNLNFYPHSHLEQKLDPWRERPPLHQKCWDLGRDILPVHFLFAICVSLLSEIWAFPSTERDKYKSNAIVLVKDRCHSLKWHWLLRG